MPGDIGATSEGRLPAGVVGHRDLVVAAPLTEEDGQGQGGCGGCGGRRVVAAQVQPVGCRDAERQLAGRGRR